MTKIKIISSLHLFQHRNIAEPIDIMAENGFCFSFKIRTVLRGCNIISIDDYATLHDVICQKLSL